MWGPEYFEVSELRNGGIVLSCGDEGMDTDLMFAAGAIDRADPSLAKQREIAEYIVKAVKFYSTANSNNETTQAIADGSTPAYSTICKYCGGEIAIRNPTGKCDHLYWPDMLTDEAKQANGFPLITKQVREWNRLVAKVPQHVQRMGTRRQETGVDATEAPEGYEAAASNNCVGCDFFDLGSGSECVDASCLGSRRRDHCDVIFKRKG